MSELNDIRKISAGFDIRAEVLAVNLLKNSADLDEKLGIEQLLISPIGDLKRKTSNEVSEVRKRFFEQDTVLQININKKGLFDTLPPYLFLKSVSDQKSPKKRSKDIEETINEARKFFLPFEQAMYQTRIEIEEFEQKYTENFPVFFEKIWGLQNFEHFLTERQKTLFCHLLPEAYRVVGNWTLTGLIFEAVLQKPVVMAFSEPQELVVPFTDKSTDQMTLGNDSVMGESFRDEFPTLDIIVKGISNSELPDYLPKGKHRFLLEELLCGYFIPIDVPYQIKIDVTSDELGFDLGEMTLGYNMVLT